jgi:S1-C subfamily serine protease
MKRQHPAMSPPIASRHGSTHSRHLQWFISSLVLAGVIWTTPELSGKDAPPPSEEFIHLPKMTVKGSPICSFGIGVICTRDSTTRKIKRVFISEVSPGSTADNEGLKEGDEILTINGRKVAGVEGDIKPGAWLFDQLADREPGETIEVEVAIRTVKKVRLSASRPLNEIPPR